LLKWLLVERATLAGDIARLQGREAVVARELKQAQERLALLTLEAERLQLCQTQLPLLLGEKQVQLAALDTAIRLASADQASPTAAGVINASCRYGKRGELKAFIVKLLQESAPEAVDTQTLTDRVTTHFGIDLPTSVERHAFKRNTIVPQLFRLTEHAVVEALHVQAPGKAGGLWRWKSAYPSMESLASSTQAEDVSVVAVASGREG
jgi:hypothetical protein